MYIIYVHKIAVSYITNILQDQLWNILHDHSTHSTQLNLVSHLHGDNTDVTCSRVHHKQDVICISRHPCMTPLHVTLT
jgi:uncharacterized Rossmann fold enzyme